MDVSGAISDVAVAARLIIGAVILLAGIVKVGRRTRTEAFIGEIGIPSAAVPAIYWMAIVTEVVSGLLLIGGFVLGAAMAACLFVIFLIALIRTRDSQQPCACLGKSSRSDSLLRKVVPRVGGLATSLALVANWEIAQGFPSGAAFVVAGLPLVWIARPRREDVAHEASSHTAAETLPARGLGTEGDPIVLNRRAAMHKFGGVALAGLAIPVTRMTNLFGVRCICQDPCPPNSRCYASETGQCYCKPHAWSEVEEAINEAYEPEPDPPCDCECQREHDMEQCDDDAECVDKCNFGFDPSGCAGNWQSCALTVGAYLACIADCAIFGDTLCELEMESRYRLCQATRPVAPGKRGEPARIETGRILRQLYGNDVERAWHLLRLHRESAPVAGFLGLVTAAQFEHLDRRVQRKFVSALSASADNALAGALPVSRSNPEGIVESAAARNLVLARQAIAMTQDRSLAPMALGKSPASPVRARAKDRASPVARRSARELQPVRYIQEKLGSSLELIRTQETINDLLHLPRGASLRSMTSEWEGDIQQAIKTLSQIRVS